KERQMFDWTQSWITLRREHQAIRSGRMIDLLADDQTYVFARQLNNETVIVAFNRENAKQVAIPANSIGLKDGTTLKSVIGVDASGRVVNGEAMLNLPAQTAVVFKAF
ncbi:MAG TPA: cyclomaltodextrinase C-terminal domain-containing protein, partial [Pyrinomonadaceae bacterium]|nr:cyclomaltodextrinase C-terminal domain-containing protein [Pyrinomonadaceae bacterium]